MEPYRIKTITAYHSALGLPKPEHPLISVIDVSEVKYLPDKVPSSLVADFYFIALKKDFKVKMRYGQQQYDFDEGVMSFMSPEQVYSVSLDDKDEIAKSGWTLVIHPDFFWNTPLARKIKQYAFFDYAVNEALFLSEKEETVVTQVIGTIRDEYHSNIDKFSHSVIMSLLEALLNYCERFYQRQFYTRRVTNHKILERVEGFLNSYFNEEDIKVKGLPSVGFVADKLNISPDYLSGVLRTLTGLNAQQHIHRKLIEKAKEKLSATELSVSEIAYELGFEHPQSFSKLFKNKTNQSPSEFRQSFN